jgi:hypothetical protein
MARTGLHRIAYARSGDKGDKVNIGLIARAPEFYDVIRAQVTEERVKQHFDDICNGDVHRYELPNFLALNFVLDDSLDGGGTFALRLDPQGKTVCDSLLLMTVEIDESLIEGGAATDGS